MFQLANGWVLSDVVVKFFSSIVILTPNGQFLYFASIAVSERNVCHITGRGNTGLYERPSRGALFANSAVALCPRLLHYTFTFEVTSI